MEFRGSMGSVARCNLTLEGSFHSRTIAKVVGALVGNITRASLGGCTEGRYEPLTASLPWPLRYAGFTGTLPRITGIQYSLVGGDFLLEEAFFADCLYKDPPEFPGRFIANVNSSTGALTSVRLDETIGHTLHDSSLTRLPCSEVLFTAGTGTVTQQGATTAITVRLI